MRPKSSNARCCRTLEATQLPTPGPLRLRSAARFCPKCWRLFPTFQSPGLNPSTNPNPSTSRSPATQPWQEITGAWFSSLPKNHEPTVGEIDAWIDSNQAALTEDFRSLPRPDLHQWLLSFHNPAPSPNQVEFPYRFQRTDLSKPVYKWLESLDMDVLVSGREIPEWLSANPAVIERLLSKHSIYHMMRLHLKSC